MATNNETMPTDQEIFSNATSKEPIEQAPDTPEKPTEAPTEDKPDRSRDDKGRFASPDTEPPTPAPEPEVEQEKGDRIPSWRLKEEADAKREWQQRAEAAERDREDFQRNIANLQAQMQRQNTPAPEPIDIFADPNAWQQQQNQTVEQRFRGMEANFSLRLAHMQHGETFEKAFSAAEGRANAGDPSVMQMVANSPDPGQNLVNWYKREQVLTQVGDDPNAFVQKKLEEALNDPAFLARALEKAKASAGAQPSNKIDIPPSLSKASGSARAGGEGYDASDRGIWEYAKQR